MNTLNIKLRHKARYYRNPRFWKVEVGYGVQVQSWLYSQLKTQLGYMRERGGGRKGGRERESEREKERERMESRREGEG